MDFKNEPGKLATLLMKQQRKFDTYLERYRLVLILGISVNSKEKVPFAKTKDIRRRTLERKRKEKKEINEYQQCYLIFYEFIK